MRGNVDTRLRKLARRRASTRSCSPRAGLQRLGRERGVGAVLDPERFVPAPGQGTLALEARADDARVREAVRGDHRRGHARVPAGRARAGARARAGCHTPLGAHAVPAGCGCLRLRAWVGLPDGSAWIRDELPGGFYDPEALGRGCRRAAARGRGRRAAADARRRWPRLSNA